MPRGRFWDGERDQWVRDFVPGHSEDEYNQIKREQAERATLNDEVEKAYRRGWSDCMDAIRKRMAEREENNGR